MPLARYGVVAGQVVDRRSEGGTDTPRRCWTAGLASGDAVRIGLGPPVALGNSGGLITLLNAEGLKVDGVAYTKAQADTEGWSLIF
jgi:hypothetical protein